MIEAEDARAQVTQLKDQLHDEQIAHAAMIRAHAAAVSAQDDRLRSAVRAAKEETETRMRELMDQQDKLHVCWSTYRFDLLPACFALMYI